MAIFGLDYYGRAKYGGRSKVDFGVEPFTAQASGFDTVLLEWAEPGGNWGGFRLLRSKAGFPITENDGALLIDIPPGYVGTPPLAYSDTHLQGGWHYYAIFLYNNGRGTWERAGAVDTLVPFDYKSTDRLWESLPDYYRVVHDSGAGYSQEKYQINPAIYLSNEQSVPNAQLINFLHIFGWGFDMLRSQADTVLDGYDVSRMHVNRLALLAEQFGASIEASSPASNNRNLVRNLGLLYRKRGTLDGIRETISLVTGWDVTVRTGENLMLNEDQANFENPRLQWWDHTVKYQPGDRVRHGLYVYQAVQVAYGVAQGPATNRSNNAYWNADSFIEPVMDRTTARTDTGDISTWQVVGPAGVLSDLTHIGVGSVDPEDGLLYNQNALAFRNETANATTDFTVRSIPLLKSDLVSFNKKLVIESGVPVPRTTKKWDSTKTYHEGDMALYKGVVYEALTTTTDVVESASWRRNGPDGRVRLSLSFFVHGPFNGTVNTGGVTVNPYVAQFDENGDLLAETVMTPTSHIGLFADFFNQPADLTSGRSPDVGAAWGANGVGTWDQGWHDDLGGYVFPIAAGRTYQLAPSLTANGNVGVTYGTVGSAQMGVIFRWSDASNFWIATNTGLYKVVAGAAPANPATGAATYTSFVAGDKMTVNLSGNNITVRKNGAVIATAIDAFNSTATRHGVVREA